MLNKSSKVAIGLIAYNHSNFIIDALKSIQEQNYKNFDLFVSVDKSIDETYYIAKDFLKKNFSNYRLYNQKKNIGVTGNCNFLLKKIKFRYKFFSLFSGDDIMHPDKILLQTKALQKNPNAPFCYSDCYWFKNKEGFKFRHFGIFQKIPKNYEDLIEDFSIPTPTIMYNAKYIRKLTFKKKFIYLSDMMMVLNLWKKFKPVFINQPLVLYRRHGESIMLSKNLTEDRVNIKKFLHAKFKKKIKTLQSFDALITYSNLIYKLRNKFTISFTEYMKLMRMAFKSVKWFFRCGSLTIYYLLNWRNKIFTNRY